MTPSIRSDRAIEFEATDHIFRRGDSTPYIAEPAVTSVIAVRALPDLIIVELLASDRHFRCVAFNAQGWLLADDLRYLTNDVKEVIGQAVSPFVSACAEALATDTVAGLQDGLSIFLPLTTEARKLLATCGREYTRPTPRRVLVHPEPVGSDKIQAQNGSLVVDLEMEAMRTLFIQKSDAIFSDLIHGNSMVMTHPVDRSVCHMRYAFCLSDVHMAYCFNSDDRSGSFIIVCSVQDTVIMEVILPASNLVFKNMMTYDVVHQINVYKDYIGRELSDLVVINLFGLFPEVKRIGDHVEGVMAILREKHVGHHLWNELAGMDRLLERGLTIPLSVAIFIGEDGEPYGRIEEIFPETAGRVTRRPFTFDSLAQHVCRTGSVPLRYTSNYVTRSLAGRLAAASTALVADAERLALKESRASGRTVVLLGIRLQDRTASNLFDFFAESIRVLADVRGSLTVVVDGFNTRNGVCDPLWVDMMNHEVSFVRDLEQSASGLDVEFVSTVGKGMYESLFWSCNMDFFISIWGAGLAKYRWIANKPGVIVSSQWNILYRSDFLIYDSREFMENSLPVEYIPLELVHDFINEGTELPQFANFEISVPGWSGFLRESIARQLGSTSERVVGAEEVALS